MDFSMKITKQITLTVEQWQIVASALDFYMKAKDEFSSYSEAKEYRSKFIQPMFNQMPDESF